VGKAVPAGARKGGFGLGADPGRVLFRRLNEHAESIRSTKNLKIDDFYCRYLVTDDIWIPLAEAMLIDLFNPVWNKLIDGFGNHDPGKGRYQQ
jgi:Eco29kI restriction endonuclease